MPRQILCDNPKTIVIKRHAYGEGEHCYNKYLLDVAKHYGVAIRLCAPYRAQTKGKVERFHRYLRESFFAPLQTAQSAPVDVTMANREGRICRAEFCAIHRPRALIAACGLRERRTLRVTLRRLGELVCA